jgi:hypothetical protein
MTPTVGRIVHMVTDLTVTHTVCIPAIITAVHADRTFEVTEFPPAGPWQDAAKRLPRMFYDNDGWHDPRECKL